MIPITRNNDGKNGKKVKFFEAAYFLKSNANRFALLPNRFVNLEGVAGW